MDAQSMDTELWLGSLSLYQAYLERTESAQAAMLSGSLSSREDDLDPENFTLFDNVAVIDVTGALTNDDSFWTRWNGDTSYNQLRRALIEAATHPDVKCIIHNIDSGGGTPNGLADVAKMNRQISALGIPVYAYSGGVMASAAYWFGASCDKVYCGETADVGSIGVISIHKDITGMLKQNGITATVLRAGKEKALNNPYEKLSDKAKEGIDERLNAVYGVFIDNIAQFRGVSPAYVRENMADGKEFIGQQAYEAGLVDGVTSLDDLITGLQKKFETAGKETTMASKTKVLTQKMQDALLEGVAPETVLATEQEVTEPEVPEGTAEVTPVVEDAPDTTEVAASIQDPKDTSIVDFLRSELSTKTNELVKLTAELSEAKGKLTALETVCEPMKKLVSTSISRMQVALGATAMDMSDLPAEVVLAQHAKYLETFCNKFPVGGVASVQPEDNSVQTSTHVSPVNKAKLRQNKI